jgi:hypothetical protein
MATKSSANRKSSAKTRNDDLSQAIAQCLTSMPKAERTPSTQPHLKEPVASKTPWPQRTRGLKEPVARAKPSARATADSIKELPFS